MCETYPMEASPRHCVAIIGGAVSGSVAAELLAEAGADVIVIEQNSRPYGKIEDGLPRWHVHQRHKEYEKLGARLSKPGVTFVPQTRLGQDIAWKELSEEWGLSAILLANGAWRDRRLPVDGAEKFLESGFEYQNPFIYWFNHKIESNFDGRQIDVPDGAVIFGGGLASIDCVKVCQIENYRRAFARRGIEVSDLDLEKKGVSKLCELHGIDDPDELGVKGCTLMYRRRAIDMPLAQPPANATPEQMEKTYSVRRKLLEVAQNKLRFHVQDCTMPLSFVAENGRVVGVKTIRTKVEGRKATPIEGSEETVPTGLIISSIGSVPEPIEGIEMKGETFAFKDWDLGVYDESKGIFGVGNVVTGQGNIRASLLHSQKVCTYLKDDYFKGALGAASAEAVQQHLNGKTPLSADEVASVHARVKAHHVRAGYEGDYASWIQKVSPADMA